MQEAKIIPITVNIKKMIDPAMAPIVAALDKYEIQDEKVVAIIEYALILFAKKMKHSRIVRKTVEHFKLQAKNATV